MDEDIQRKLAVLSFFGGAGYKIFKEELDGIEEWIDAELKATLANSVDEAELAKLNYKIGFKSGLNRVLLVLESMKEEIEDKLAPSQGVKLGFAVKE